MALLNLSYCKTKIFEHDVVKFVRIIISLSIMHCLSRSRCKLLASIVDFIAIYAIVSSANCRIVVFRLTGISFISYRNRQVPKTDPRGTPHSTIFHLQLSQLVSRSLKSFISWIFTK